MEEKNTLIIEITNLKALGLLHELEELNLIRVLRDNINPLKIKLSEKYRGIIGKEERNDLVDHICQIRDEWRNI